MRIDLLRHAEAEDASPTGRDAERPLTDAGRKRMKGVARAIALLEPGYDAVLVSPLVRARETAEPVAAALGFRGALHETKALQPGADPDEVLAELARLGPKSALLVGHMPHLGRLFGRLVTGRDGLEVPMKKASLASFETGADPASGTGELRLYLPPRVLSRLS